MGGESFAGNELRTFAAVTTQCQHLFIKRQINIVKPRHRPAPNLSIIRLSEDVALVFPPSRLSILCSFQLRMLSRCHGLKAMSHPKGTRSRPSKNLRNLSSLLMISAKSAAPLSVICDSGV